MSDIFPAGAVPPAPPDVGVASAVEAGDGSSYASIIRLALPLVLSMTGTMLMMMVDGLFLAWHGEKDIAALGFASMAVWAVTSLFSGPAGYTSTFVAQYYGADRPGRIGPSVWQGIYFALASGVCLAAISPVAGALFALTGHEPELLVREVAYFRINCTYAVFGILGAAVSGYFSGLGRTRLLMAVQLAGIALNAVLDYALIFGRLGFAPRGIAGAAAATVIAQACVACTLAAFFVASRQRHAHASVVWRPERELLLRLMRFGFPNGMRFFVESMGWTAFVAFVGRLGSVELAATSIAFRINTIAFFPMIGLSIAVGVLTGQAQGRRRSDIAERATWRALVIAEAWILAAGVCFLVFPRQLMGFFHDPENVSAETFRQIADAGTVLLRFVAVYCLVDSFNVVLLGALQGAGDTRWTTAATVVLYVVFAAVLVVMDRVGCGLYVEWTAATVFVFALALTWLWRFRSGAWRRIEVIERVGDNGVPAG